MNRIKRAVPSPALLVAVAALVAALAGTAVAGPDATTSLNKKKTRQLANKQAKKQINKTLPIDSSELDDGAVSGSKLGSIQQVTQTTTLTPSGTPNASQSTTASCPDGSKVLGGGFETPVSAAAAIVEVQQSKRTNNGWVAGATNFTGNAQPLTAYAYCLDSNG